MEFHVLLVEDDRVTLKTVEQLLRKCNYKVTCAANGREAIKVLTTCRQRGVKVDLILTDILMPEVTGFDLINEVVHGDIFCDVPVVVMSSQDSQESVLQAFQAGAADYLIKPIRKNELATLWQHVWRANKAKGAGNGSMGHTGEGAAGAKPDDRAAHIKDSSGGSSSAAMSVLQSTGGTVLPSRAATTRYPTPSGPSELSGEETQQRFHAKPHRAHRHHGHHHGHHHHVPAAVQDSSVQQGVLGGGLGAGLAQPATVPHSFPFNTSVAVHFDLNPAPDTANRPTPRGAGSSGNFLQGNAAGADGDVPAAAAACAAGTSATVINWSHADLAESAEEGALEQLPSKRLRLERPATRATADTATAAAAASAAAGPGFRSGTGPCHGQGQAGPASRLVAAEGSQSSRAASGRDGAREGTASPSGETFAESPSAYTSATTTTTTGSGSEAEEQQQQDTAGGVADAGLAGPHAGAGRYGSVTNATGAEPGAAASGSRTHGTGYNVRRTATSAGPATTGPAHVMTDSFAVAAAAPGAPGAVQDAGPGLGAPSPAADADHGAGANGVGACSEAAALHHSLPHPAAAAPGSAAPGCHVTLPLGLQELANLGAQRHQELWTQRALMHRQQQQHQQQCQQHQQHQQQQQRQQQERIEVSAARSGLVPSPSAAVVSGRCPAAAAAGSNGMPASASTTPAAAAPAAAAAAASNAAGRAPLPHPHGAAAEASQHRQDSTAAADHASIPAESSARTNTTASAAADAAATATGVGASSPAPGGLSVLRHSDRSAFTAFTVFLPGKVAAAACTGAIAPPMPGCGGLTGLMAASAAGRPRPPPPPPIFSHAGPPPGAGTMYNQHQYAHQHSHATLPPPARISILPPVMPLHTSHTSHGPPPQHCGLKPQDPTGHPVGVNGQLAAAAAAMAAHMPYAGMQQRQPGALIFGPPHHGPPHHSPPVFIPEPVLQLIAHLSGRAAAEIPVPETVTQAPVVVQKPPSAARLAAVAKYLEKRKHRNFKKKVRYESRKRLAEARPRVRGQFVKAASTAASGAVRATAAALLPTADMAGAAALVAAGGLQRGGAAPMDVDSTEPEHDAENDEMGEQEDTDDSAAEL